MKTSDFKKTEISRLAELVRHFGGKKDGDFFYSFEEKEFLDSPHILVLENKNENKCVYCTTIVRSVKIQNAIIEIAGEYLDGRWQEVTAQDVMLGDLNEITNFIERIEHQKTLHTLKQITENALQEKKQKFNFSTQENKNSIREECLLQGTLWIAKFFLMAAHIEPTNGRLILELQSKEKENCKKNVYADECLNSLGIDLICKMIRTKLAEFTEEQMTAIAQLKETYKAMKKAGLSIIADYAENRFYITNTPIEEVCDGKAEENGRDHINLQDMIKEDVTPDYRWYYIHYSDTECFKLKS